MDPPAMHQSWADHPLCLPLDVSWVLWGLVFLCLLPIADLPWAGWLVVLTWLGLNAGLTGWALLRRPSLLDVERGSLEEAKPLSLFQDALGRLRRNRLASVSAILVTLIFVLCFSQRAAYLAFDLNDPSRPAHSSWLRSFAEQHLDHARGDDHAIWLPPSTRHWFGTDALRHDLFARTLFGGQISFIVSLMATALSLVIGVAWGATAGFLGGRIDHYMMRFVDILYGLPFMFLVILLLSMVLGLQNVAARYAPQVEAMWELERQGRWQEARDLADAAQQREEALQRGLSPAEADRIADEERITSSIIQAVRLRPFLSPFFAMFFAMGLVSWLTMAQIVRGQVLSLREREFVQAARVAGASTARIIRAHIVPNLLGPVIVYTTLTIPTIMLTEAFLSFLGLGISPPDCSWGSLARDGMAGMDVVRPCWWLVTYPAVAISLTLFSLNFIGDGLRDALDPRGAR